MKSEIEDVAREIAREQALIQRVLDAMASVIVGQQYLMERILVALLCNGHILIEGVPGLAKTKVVKSLAQLIDARFQRIQFTPDLLPADLIGTLIYNPHEGVFTTRKGPIFANIVLADEINRAPAKVHSALLEAMEERQVTIGEVSYLLEDPFLVLATQNPIEQEGTYPLPEAQMDRFMLKIVITYPSREEEREIMRRAGHVARNGVLGPLIHRDDIVRMRALVDAIYLDEKIEKYILDLVFATREPARHGFPDLERFITYGASPRASINLVLAARAMAFLRGRGYVVPQDVKDVAADVLRHRIIPSYEADAEGMTVDRLIDRLLAETVVP
ncbi:MAG: AAA family ATPase [Thiobacillaceae bacterium]|jgi:MoxR-like ATPase|nr:AAA family ATPase [Hydrogenophilales bacterium]MBP8901830.1 AAA family ATPase [Thiobacillaceae bacterium]MBP9915291.1 AAA family ATPase [Thiobacillaceae bacterium]